LKFIVENAGEKPD